MLSARPSRQAAANVSSRSWRCTRATSRAEGFGGAEQLSRPARLACQNSRDAIQALGDFKRVAEYLPGCERLAKHCRRASVVVQRKFEVAEISQLVGRPNSVAHQPEVGQRFVR